MCVQGSAVELDNQNHIQQRNGESGGPKAETVTYGLGWVLDGALVNDALGLQVPDLDGGSACSAQPVAVGGECQSVDDITTCKSEGRGDIERKQQRKENKFKTEKERQ